MRGWGAPLTQYEEYEGVTDPLTYPDWGWGDAEPSSWDSSLVDYGWGSDHGDDIPAYVVSTSQRLGDDGGYLIEIAGVWPRLGASPRQRPTGYTVTLIDAQNVRWPCYSGRAGQGFVCSTDLRAQTLSAYTPRAPVGVYDVEVRYAETTVIVGQTTLSRRTRTREEYALRAALPSLFATGARALEYETLLTSSAPSADQETHSTLSTLLRVAGQSLAELSAQGVVTRLTAELAPSDASLTVESTLGFTPSGAVRVGGVLVTYASVSGDTLSGLARPLGQPYHVTAGTEVTHDPHVIAD